jgi:hypothetical protein
VDDVVLAKKACTVLGHPCLKPVQDADYGDAIPREIERLLGLEAYDGNYSVMGDLAVLALQERTRYDADATGFVSYFFCFLSFHFC